MKGKAGKRDPAGEALPLLAALKEQAEAVRQEELREALGKLRDLSPAQRRELDALTRRLVNRLLRRPLGRLRGREEDEGAIRELFGIDKRG